MLRIVIEVIITEPYLGDKPGNHVRATLAATKRCLEKTFPARSGYKIEVKAISYD